MHVTSIFTFSHNLFLPFMVNHFSHIKFIICICFHFNLKFCTMVKNKSNFRLCTRISLGRLNKSVKTHKRKLHSLLLHPLKMLKHVKLIPSSRIQLELIDILICFTVQVHLFTVLQKTTFEMFVEKKNTSIFHP